MIGTEIIQNTENWQMSAATQTNLLNRGWEFESYGDSLDCKPRMSRNLCKHLRDRYPDLQVKILKLHSWPGRTVPRSISATIGEVIGDQIDLGYLINITAVLEYELPIQESRRADACIATP